MIFACCTTSLYHSKKNKTQKITNIIVVYFLPSIFIFRQFLMDFRCGSNFADDNFRDILDNLNFVDEILCDIYGGLLSTEKNIIHEICEIQSGRKFIYLGEFGTAL